MVLHELPRQFKGVFHGARNEILIKHHESTMKSHGETHGTFITLS